MLESNLAEFWGWRLFMQIRQRIFKCFTVQICRLFFTAFWNFWRITRLFATNHRWVISAQTGPFFGRHCILLFFISVVLLQSVTCHIESRRVTYHLTLVNMLWPHFNQAGCFSIYLFQMDGMPRRSGWLVCIDCRESPIHVIDSNLTCSRTHNFLILSQMPCGYALTAFTCSW